MMQNESAAEYFERPIADRSSATITQRIAVLGGGVAGVVISRELTRNPQFHVDLLEKERRLGGLMRSVQIYGLYYDIGAFVFDRSHELFNSFPSLRDLFVSTEYTSLEIPPSLTIDKYPMSARGYLRDNSALRIS